jgi:hypothetical protein
MLAFMFGPLKLALGKLSFFLLHGDATRAR